MAERFSYFRPPRHAVAFFVGMALTAWFLLGCSQPEPPADLIRQARSALRQKQFAKVAELVDAIPRTAPQWQAGQLLAGEAATKDGQLDVALRHYRDAVRQNESSDDGQLALFSAAEIHLDRAELVEAERLYRLVLQHQPNNGITNARLAFLLSITGRRWEALDPYFVLIKGGDADYRELALAADVGRDIEQKEFLDRCRRREHPDKLVRLVLAADAFSEGRADAEQQLIDLVADHAELTAAQAMLGELLIDAADSRRFVDWYRALPAGSSDSPDILFVCGLWARTQGELDTAVECFWQTVIRTPFHRRAFYSLGQTLVALKDPAAAGVVDYSEDLIQLSQTVDQVLISKGNDQRAVRRTAELLERLGRIWETCAWAVVGRNRFPQATWPSEIFERQSGKLTPELPRIEVDRNPVAGRKASTVGAFAKLVDAAARIANTNAEAPGVSTGLAAIGFAETGLIAFEYFNSDDPATKGVRTFEQTGGGVAILDFDRDNAPDVFLTQGTDWKTGSSVPTPAGDHQDGLFRNRGGCEFDDAAEALPGTDTGYGQGCSAADFDNDGFSDVYVANVGRNRLLQNMGDGTFQDVTPPAMIRDESWTVSTMVCDLNADGLPDIFDVNYLRGEGVFEKICEGRACSPAVFPGARDRLLINQGDGRFRLLADATPEVDSRGLGVVAFEMEPNRRPVVFIANDQVANYFLNNRPADNADNIELLNDALITGLAFNDQGVPMACMGIAVDDWDGNQLSDLLVTNFHNEANTLYLQDAKGLFVDATKAAGLKAASMPFTGWGTQSLDADLDGWPDLVIANGHVDDYRDEGGEYHMRPQFFHNRHGQFQELLADDIGEWFGDKYLGRGLARVDWNQDGRPEFIVSHINARVAVLQNTTTGAGHFLQLKLHATETARDAIGALVTVRSGNRQVTRQLMAGDGYMASNQRILEFGLGTSDAVDEVIVRWPSSAETRFTSPPIDAMLHVVEGCFTATVSHGQQMSALSVTDVTPGATSTESEP